MRTFVLQRADGGVNQQIDASEMDFCVERLKSVGFFRDLPLQRTIVDRRSREPIEVAP
ncbi:hypothetical protein D932_02730 [Enterococcus casseliflavus 14-MB-W-14]|nr:hypothetical protein D932_02730 [Enterococcus casseliflavus 14-MB-W-14]EPH93456.1 hypothetical protein D922_01998 [Enterococcus faecalis 06-MB-DW-09]